MQKRALILGLMLAVLAAGAAWAQQPTTASPVTGRVASIDPMEKTFTVQTSTGNLVFKTDGQTMFMRDDTRVNLSDLKVGDQIRVTYTGADPDRIAAHVDTVGTGNAYQSAGSAATTGMGTTVTGRVTSVDVAGRQVTIETASGSQTYLLGTDARIMARNGSTDFSSISTGDQVRLQVSSDSRTASRIDFISGDTSNESGTVSANRQLPRTGSSFPLFGAAGIAMIALALGLRERRLRLV